MRMFRRVRWLLQDSGGPPVAPGLNIVAQNGDLLVTDTGLELITG